MQPIRLRCTHCEHVWPENILVGIEIRVWIAHMQSLRCPCCAADYRSLLLLGNEDEELRKDA